jgi:hypothetical protein
MHRRLPPAVATAVALAAALALPGAAQAQQIDYTYFQVGVAPGEMSVQLAPTNIASTEGMVGIRFNAYLGAQIVGTFANNPFHQRLATNGTPLYDYKSYIGPQVVGYWPLTAYWDMVGSLGVGRARYGTAQPGYGDISKTDGMVGIGVRWQVVPHFAVSAQVTQVVSASSTSAAGRFEFDF